jgi:hypothetical protein
MIPLKKLDKLVESIYVMGVVVLFLPPSLRKRILVWIISNLLLTPMLGLLTGMTSLMAFSVNEKDFSSFVDHVMTLKARKNAE